MGCRDNIFLILNGSIIFIYVFLFVFIFLIKLFAGPFLVNKRYERGVKPTERHEKASW